MGKLEIQVTQYGTWNVVTSSGAEFRLNDRNGRLEVRTETGLLAVLPMSSNLVELAAQNYRGQERGPAPAQSALEEAWAEGCRKGLATNPGWDEQALDANPYAGDGHG